jgi:hypothetical protein
MIFSDYKKSILSKRMLYRIGRKIASIFTFFGVILGAWSVFDNEFFTSYGLHGLVVVFIFSIILAIYLEWPKRTITKIFTHPDIKITVKVGDILQEKSHIVIGFSDTFDTELGDIINPDSLQGKFLSLIYGHNKNKLDKEIAESLEGKTFTIDSTKTKGKNKRYEIFLVECHQL